MTHNELFERYPFLRPRNYLTDELEPINELDPYILGIDDLPVGWKELFLQMCEDIRGPLTKANLLDEFRLEQVKEKYGEMRIYHNVISQAIQDIINDYSYVSQFICMKCGKPATCQTKGWVMGLCDECGNKAYENLNNLEFNPEYSYIKFCNDNGTTKVIRNIQSIWERLFPSGNNEQNAV